MELGITASLVLLLLAFEESLAGSKTWPDLKVKFALFPSNGFFDQPKTVEDAENAGWRKIEGECDNGRFLGLRYAPPANEVVNRLLMYDIKGIISGIQSVVEVAATDNDKYYDFSNNSVYNIDRILDTDVYVTTAYIISTDVICTTGRTIEQLESGGTGNTLLIQTGPTPASLLQAPLTQKEADDDKLWYEHKCFVNMGKHYMQISYDENASCRDFFPVQLLYDNGNLRGFVWFHVGNHAGDWEVLNTFAVENILKTVPKCLYNLLETPGVRALHVFLDGYLDFCLFE